MRFTITSNRNSCRGIAIVNPIVKQKVANFNTNNYIFILEILRALVSWKKYLVNEVWYELKIITATYGQKFTDPQWNN